MNGPAAPFLPPTPAMIVGHSTTETVPPLGLGEPFALLGGDRLGPAGIPFELMHEWQPRLLDAVSDACHELLAAERPWFRMRPTALVGMPGCGRTHAARRLAWAAGVTHVILNLSDPVIAMNVSASEEVGEALWVSPVVTAMAATRCANPIVTVVGAEQNADAAMALVAMIDPTLGRAWREDRIETTVDLGEVTWLVQAPSATDLPQPLREQLDVVEFAQVECRGHDAQTLSVLLEVLDDLRLPTSDPAISWSGVVDRIRWFGLRSPKQAYAALRTAVIDAQYEHAVARQRPGSAEAD